MGGSLEIFNLAWIFQDLEFFQSFGPLGEALSSEHLGTPNQVAESTTPRAPGETPKFGRRGQDPHPQDEIQHLDFTKDPRPLHYKTPPCAFYHKMSVVKPFSVLSKDEIGPESKTGRFLSKAEVLGVLGVFSPLPINAVRQKSPRGRCLLPQLPRSWHNLPSPRGQSWKRGERDFARHFKRQFRWPQGPKDWKKSISLETFKLDLLNSSPPPEKIGVLVGSTLENFQSRLKNFSPGGRSWMFSIFGPLGEGNCESKNCHKTVGSPILPRGI